MPTIDDMTTGAIDCLQWLAYQEPEEEGKELTSIDLRGEEFPTDLRQKVREDCEGFLSGLSEAALQEVSSDPNSAGADFVLTRNRHGAGFWDGGWENGEELTDAAHTYSEGWDLVRSTDGQLYLVG